MDLFLLLWVTTTEKTGNYTSNKHEKTEGERRQTSQGLGTHGTRLWWVPGFLLASHTTKSWRSQECRKVNGGRQRTTLVLSSQSTKKRAAQQDRKLSDNKLNSSPNNKKSQKKTGHHRKPTLHPCQVGRCPNLPSNFLQPLPLPQSDCGNHLQGLDF